MYLYTNKKDKEMKVYNYSNGEKAVFINDEKTIITDNQGIILEHFQSTLNKRCEDYKHLVRESDKTILEESTKYDLKKMSGEENGIKAEFIFLMQVNEPVDFVFFRDGENKTGMIGHFTAKEALELAKSQGLK